MNILEIVSSDMDTVEKKNKKLLGIFVFVEYVVHKKSWAEVGSSFEVRNCCDKGMYHIEIMWNDKK